MSDSYFVIRDECPACASENLEVIYENPFDEPPIRDYLDAFYSPQGRLEYAYLREAVYSLCECRICGLIFQGQVPNDRLMERLYENWIDPEKALIQHRQDDRLGRDAHIAKETVQIVTHFRQRPSSLRYLDFGMGWGEWALMARAFGCDVWLRPFQRAHAIRGGKWHQGDLLAKHTAT